MLNVHTFLKPYFIQHVPVECSIKSTLTPQSTACSGGMLHKSYIELQIHRKGRSPLLHVLENRFYLFGFLYFKFKNRFGSVDSAPKTSASSPSSMSWSKKMPAPAVIEFAVEGSSETAMGAKTHNNG